MIDLPKNLWVTQYTYSQSILYKIHNFDVQTKSKNLVDQSFANILHHHIIARPHLSIYILWKEFFPVFYSDFFVSLENAFWNKRKVCSKIGFRENRPRKNILQFTGKKRLCFQFRCCRISLQFLSFALIALKSYIMITDFVA